MYIKSNISALLLKNEDYDYYTNLNAILNEPPEIPQAVLEPSPKKFENLNENKKSIIKYAKKYIEKNTLAEENKIFIIEKYRYLDLPISPQNKDYTMIIKLNDDTMSSKQRLLIIDFNSSKQLLKEWREAFINIAKIIESVI